MNDQKQPQSSTPQDVTTPLVSSQDATHVSEDDLFHRKHLESFPLALSDIKEEERKKTSSNARKKHRQYKKYKEYRYGHHPHKHLRTYDRPAMGSDVHPSYLTSPTDTFGDTRTANFALLDEIENHRYDNFCGLRKHKIQRNDFLLSLLHFNRKEKLSKTSVSFFNKYYSHQPHEVFIQLDELVSNDNQYLEWRETARWIKYEENLEKDTNRWSKPHIAPLSFHSLLTLRKCLEHGILLLDLEENGLPDIAYRIVEAMVLNGKVLTEHQEDIWRVLLLRHRHMDEQRSTPFFLGKKLHTLSHVEQDKSQASETKYSIIEGSESPEEDMQSNLQTVSTEVFSQKKSNIFQRIPDEAEATSVSVGSLSILEQPVVVFVRLARGQLLPNVTEVSIPVRFLFILLGPTQTDLDYHEIGRSISTLMSNKYFHEVAYVAEEKNEFLSAVNYFLTNSIVLPPGDWKRSSLLSLEEIKRRNKKLDERKENEENRDEKENPQPTYNPFEHHGKLFQGLFNDMNYRYPYFVSDFLDGLNVQCLATIFFIYFAALSGAITFGGLMDYKTKNVIGVSETLIVTAGTGFLFSLVAGQPLIIIGTTGPLLLFDEILFKFCLRNDMEFLTLRVWISFWVAFIATVVVAFEGSAFVSFFGRFTQEIYAALISMIYIYECFFKIYKVFSTNPLLASYCNLNTTNPLEDNPSVKNCVNVSCTQNSSDSSTDANETSISFEDLSRSAERLLIHPNTALFSMILMMGTFFIAYFLRHFRNSRFLGSTVRRAIGDFGITIGIVLMVLLDSCVKNVYTQKLSVTEELHHGNTLDCGWFISPLGIVRPIAAWHVLSAFVAALLIFILLFLEIQITELIINKKERKLKKGSGFHLDLMLICYMEIGCAVIGGPWVCAATIRSLSHVISLTVMSKTHAPGEIPHVVEVKEQRVTNLIVSVLIGLSILVAPLLRKIPVAILFGVFLYMGVSSMSGIQLFERIRLLFMSAKHHPDVPYVRNVPTRKMHMFTIIQIICLAVLWVVKSTEAEIAFPFILLMMVPVRLQLKKCFTEKELLALDGDETKQANEEEDPDIYRQILP
ncbi:band 3 anion transport protein-like isoform X2 [Tachypleus tridentatus]